MPLALYIDETGDFSDARARDVAVCGLFGDERLHAHVAPRLRAAAAEFAPEVPWPWHAAHLNRGVMWALWHAAEPRSDAPAAFWREPADQLAEKVRPHAQQAWRQSFEALRVGRRPKLEWVQEIERAAWIHDPEGLEPLEVRQSQVLSFLTAWLAQFAVHARSVAAVIAAESAILDGAQRDRYLALLPVTVGRAVDLALTEPVQGLESTELHLHVLDRDVIDNSIGKTGLHLRHLHAAATLATGSPQRERRRAGQLVRVIPVEVTTFSDDAHASFVLADRLANAAGRVLRNGATADYVSLAAALTQETGLTFWPEVERSCVAAGGPAQAYIDHHRDQGLHPRPGAPDLKSCRPWAASQARAWAAELA